ncbi:hypothetical protein SAMN05444004_106134 [Jannaschia faecimaris]|uniref:Uncharacterized protein n=1 Tax=Jannaschia faecimaris TaxID=1244108 RepID=A0A1H3QI73_9RHOB|nr:hypothetical protein SAMN05444004_106134 [Jannaschia faecimaris]
MCLRAGSREGLIATAVKQKSPETDPGFRFLAWGSTFGGRLCRIDERRQLASFARSLRRILGRVFGWCLLAGASPFGLLGFRFLLFGSIHGSAVGDRHVDHLGLFCDVLRLGTGVLLLILTLVATTIPFPSAIATLRIALRRICRAVITARRLSRTLWSTMATGILVSAGLLPGLTTILVALLLVALLLVALLLPRVDFLLRSGQHTGVMLRMLLEILDCHAITGQLGVTRQLIVFIDDLGGRTAHLAFGAGAVEDTIDDVSATLLVSVTVLVPRTGLATSHA